MQSAPSLFHRLSAICRKKADYERYFPGCRLIAIVISNSDSGKFDNVVRDNTDLLLSRIPEDFGIITFSGEPKSWKNAKEDKIGRRLGILCSGPYYPGGFVSSMQSRLNLRDEAAIIITGNLLSNRYAVLPTYRKKVIDSIISIGQWMTKFHDSRCLFDYISSIPSNYYIASTADGRSLARNLMETVAIWASESSDKKESASAENCVRTTLRRLKRRSERSCDDEMTIKDALGQYSDYFSLVTKAKKRLRSNGQCMYYDLCYIPFDRFEFSDNTSSDVTAHGFVLNGIDEDLIHSKGFENFTHKDRPSDRFQLPPSMMQGLEKVSCKEIFNYNELLPHLLDVDKEEIKKKYAQYGCNFFDDEEAELDLKPLGNHLANAIEEEINASLIQLMRTLFDIGMPEYYRLFDRSKDYCSIQTKNKTIQLNRRFRDIGGDFFSVKPVCLGETGCVLKEKSEDPSWRERLGVFGNEEFITAISEFARLRNGSSHAGPVKIEEFESIFNAFLNIVEDYLPELLEIKRKLKRRNTPEDNSAS